jgi:hypothetical protein
MNRDKHSFLETTTAAPEQTQLADQVNNSDIIYPREISPFVGEEYFTMCFAFTSLSRAVGKLPKPIIADYFIVLFIYYNLHVTVF